MCLSLCFTTSCYRILAEEGLVQSYLSLKDERQNTISYFLKLQKFSPFIPVAKLKITCYHELAISGISLVSYFKTCSGFAR